MNAEFNWWLLIVGLVVGAGLVWLIVADSRRREVDVSEAEREGEAQWISAAMSDAGRPVGDDDTLDILRLHAEYLTAPPPDDPSDDALDDRLASGPPAARSAAEDGRGSWPDPVERRTMAHRIGSDHPDRDGGSPGPEPG